MARLQAANSGEQLALFLGHEREVMSMHFNRDGSRVLTANNDGTARIWDVRSDTRIPAAIRQRTAGKILDVTVGDAGVWAVAVAAGDGGGAGSAGARGVVGGRDGVIELRSWGRGGDGVWVSGGNPGGMPGSGGL